MCAKDLVETTGIEKSLVGVELEHFKPAGYLEELPQVDGMRKKYLRPVRSAYWRLAAEFLEELTSSERNHSSDSATA